jgi:hypothetical protein
MGAEVFYGQKGATEFKELLERRGAALELAKGRIEKMEPGFVVIRPNCDDFIELQRG